MAEHLKDLHDGELRTLKLQVQQEIDRRLAEHEEVIKPLEADAREAARFFRNRVAFFRTCEHL